MTNTLERLNTATRMLAEAKTLDEFVHIRDLAQAASSYARAAKLGLKAQNQAAEIKMLAEVEAGKLLAVMDKAQGKRTDLLPAGKEVDGPPTYAELGIAYATAHRWQTMAKLPDEHIKEYIADNKNNGHELTSAGLYREAKKQERKEQQKEPPAFPVNTFSVIYADPPWSYDNSGFDQSAASHYPTMSTAEICALDVPGLCTDDTVLFLWATSPLLDQAFKVIQVWGFTYKASMVWDKGKAPPIGWFVKTEHELLLIATRANNVHPQVKPDSIVRALVGRHSEKPAVFYDIIESMYPGPYCELFARNTREGWESWGNEI